MIIRGKGRQGAKQRPELELVLDVFLDFVDRYRYSSTCKVSLKKDRCIVFSRADDKGPGLLFK